MTAAISADMPHFNIERGVSVPWERSLQEVQHYVFLQMVSWSCYPRHRHGSYRQLLCSEPKGEYSVKPVGSLTKAAAS
jgi:hypothetical protein